MQNKIVKILNREYIIKQEIDSIFLERIVNYIETKIKNISEETEIVDTSKLAILLSIDLVKELFELKLQIEQVERDLNLLEKDLDTKLLINK